MLTAKLLVPLGAPLQLKAGETLPPVQPNPLKTCSLTIAPPSLRSELIKVIRSDLLAHEVQGRRHIGNRALVELGQHFASAGAACSIRGLKGLAMICRVWSWGNLREVPKGTEIFRRFIEPRYGIACC